MKRKTIYHKIEADGFVRETRKVNFRLVFMTFFGVLFFMVLYFKLIVLQVIDHDYYADLALINIKNRKIVPARRGTIYDAKGRTLAKDVIQYSVIVRADATNDKVKLVEKLSSILNMSESTIHRIMKKKSSFAYIAHKIYQDKAEQLKKIDDPGLDLEKRFLRVYPYRENGAHTIGFCDVNNNPLGGIEYQYNHYLQGKPGWKIYQKDALGMQLPDLNYAGENSIDGLDISLTLNIDYQIIIEDELKSTVEHYKALDGVAILMNPFSGEILALANYPQFDPNIPNKYDLNARKNRAICDVVEPGSTFKIILFSAAMEHLELDLDGDIIYCENGKFKLADQMIEDHKKYGWLTPRKIFENSSNIGTMKIMQKLRKEIFYRYVRNFGFGMITGVDLPGESPGILHTLKEFSKTTPYFMSIGYEIGVTPLQLVNAYAVLANKGKLVMPYILKKAYGLNNLVIEENQPETIRHVLSPKTAKLMKEFLIGVVKEGTGKQAILSGLTVAAKTGTAQVYNRKSGSYDRNKHLASFAGYFPAEDPRFVLLVLINQPKGVYYGGVVAAPTFRKIAHRITGLISSEKLDFADASAQEKQFSLSDIPIPTVEKLDLLTAKSILEERGFKVDVVGDGEVVYSQQLMSDSENEKIIRIKTIERKNIIEDKFNMPSLHGLSLKEALGILADYQLVPSVEGYGIVVRQLPAAGTKIDLTNPVKLICEPS